MSKPRYLSIDKGNIRVIFPPNVNSISFESILSKCYKLTLQYDEKKVIFDFRDVIWCDVFELSLLSLWILELIKIRNISFIYPNSIRTINFFRAYKFEHFLSVNNIDVERKPQNNELKYDVKFIDQAKPFFPLTFFDEKDFNNFLSDLYYGDRLRILLNEIKDYDLVKDGHIRNIVLKELGDNIFVHSSGKYANIIMTKFGSESSDKAGQWAKLTLKQSTELEKPFFRKLYGRSYLCLVISDKGSGIFNTLKSSYINDITVENKTIPPREEDVLEFAFRLNSSSRTTESRLGPIRKYISGESHDIPPPTGLYRLKRLVSEFHGFIYLRSGSTVISYDFYNNNNDKPTFSTNIGKNNLLSNFGGTQYKLLFPIRVQKDKATYFIPLFDKNTEKEEIGDYHYISARSYFTSETANDLDKQAIQLNSLLTHIADIKSSKKENIIVLDCDNNYISEKALHYILIEGLQPSYPNGINIAINVSDELIEQTKDIFIQRYSKDVSKGRFIKPFILYNKYFIESMVGVNETESMYFDNIAKGEYIPDEGKEYAAKNNHLYKYDYSAGSYEFIHSRSKILRVVRKAIRSKIKDIVWDSSREIFKDVKVLTLSGVFCRGYFETFRLFEDEYIKEYMGEWVKCTIIDYTPDLIISVSNHCGHLVDEALSKFEIFRKIKASHIIYDTPIKSTDLSKLIFSPDKSKKVLIFTDVIGTGNTISCLFEYLKKSTEIKLVSIIDAQDKEGNDYEYDGKKVEIDCLVKHRISYEDSKPPEWRYKDIHLVDPDTHTLVKTDIKPDGPIWKGIIDAHETIIDDHLEIKKNTFINDIITPTGSFIEGHYVSGDKHFTYVFNLPNILRYFVSDIAVNIANDIKEIERFDKYKYKITHILFPDFNRGNEDISNEVSKHFPQSTIIKITREEFITVFDQYEKISGINGVIIIDDAFVQGDTVFRLMDIAERKGAKKVYIYVVIKRGTDYLARRLENVKQYGESQIHVRYLADAEIPSYSHSECPVCSRIREYEAILNIMHTSSGMVSYIQQRLDLFYQKDVNIVLEELQKSYSEIGIAKPGEGLSLRWKLEVAKKDIGTRNELAMLVKHFMINRDTALTFIRVLAYEGYIYLIDKRFSDLIFYDRFKHYLSEACKYYLNDLRKLNNEDLDAIIEVLFILDKEYIVDNYGRFLLDSLENKDRLLSLLVKTLIFKKFLDYPTRVLAILNNLRGDFSLDQDLYEIIEYFIKYWENQRETLVDSVEKRLSSYNNISGGALHNIRHQIDGILKNECKSISSLRTAWENMKYDLHNKIIPQMKAFIRNSFLSKNIEDINDKILQLNVIIEECTNIWLLNLGNEIEKKEEIEDNFKQLIKRLQILVFEKEEGLKDTLQNFVCEVKSLIDEIVSHYDYELREKHIECIVEFPEEKCIVFGEREDIFIVIKNLVENIIIHSGCNLFKIIVVLEGDNVRLYIMDNGKGIGDIKKIDLKHGLKKAYEHAKNSCGELIMYNMSRDSQPNAIYDIKDEYKIITDTTDVDLIHKYYKDYNTVIQFVLKTFVGGR